MVEEIVLSYFRVLHAKCLHSPSGPWYTAKPSPSTILGGVGKLKRQAAHRAETERLQPELKQLPVHVDSIKDCVWGKEELRKGRVPAQERFQMQLLQCSPLYC